MADPVVQQITNTTIPDYAKRYVEELLGVGASTIYQYKKNPDGTTATDEDGMPIIAGFQPFKQYTGERQAQFTPLQQQSYEAAGLLGIPSQMYDASQMAKLAAQMAGQTSYTPSNFQSSMVNAPQLQQYQMAAPKDLTAKDFTTAGVAGQYMSPYQQQVTDIQKREAARQSAIQGTQQQAQAVQAGAFGGSRDAIMRAERERNLAQQMNDIQAQGSNQAYGQAMQQFNADQARQMAAQQGNQQAGLTVGQQNLAAQLGVQQLGSGQTMQAQLANQQAMNAMNQLNEQSSQYGAGLGLQGLQTALSGAGQLGNLGQNIYAQNQGNINLQNQLGTQQQQQVQNMLNNNYQDFQNAQNLPYRQLGYMSDLLRGTQGLGQANVYQYNNPSPISQIGGLATTAYAANKMFGSAKGGMIKDEYARGGKVKGHGLVDLALSRMA
jgi:hypothetical protein